MDIKMLIQGALATNSYIVSLERNCILIDPQGTAFDFKQYIQEHGLHPVAILLTHGHFDHIGAVETVRQEYKIPVYVSARERALLTNPNLNLSPMVSLNLSLEADYYINQEETLRIENFTIQVIETPGHTSGSLCYIIENHLFSGDTLFRQSYGRYDFPTGNYSNLQESILKLLSLPDNYTVHPGHGESTSLEFERKYNPMVV